MQQFLRQNTPDFIAADEWASYSPDLNLLDYCIWDIIMQNLVYEGRRLPFANLREFKEAVKNKWKRSPLRQFENLLQNGKPTECSKKAEWRRDSTHFLLITMPGYRSHAVRRIKLIGYFVRFGHPILFYVFHC